MIPVRRLDEGRLERARFLVRELGSVLVAYSGGVDSSLLLKLCLEELPGRAVAALASSPAYPEEDQERARQLARQLGAPLVEVATEEVSLEAYRRNAPDRCFHCKEELFGRLAPIQAQLGLAQLAYGANADDSSDHRPGHGSALRRGVRFPLLEAGLGKAEIRLAARALGLPNWNQPAMACLSSRIPFGQPVTESSLRLVESAEAAVRARGFRQVRVRHLGGRARVEVESDEVPALMRQAEDVRSELIALGFEAVECDPEGYRTGKLSGARSSTSG